ncbi:sensor domain-containing diguanylate cyclase [Halodesulfovibrio aestuarii]|uniref:PAS domain S-box-containing protein/diguanylate cyclase (GGDEF) domain-containing protein n=1 Tax=Halodesulfovibrio aestuarii TaxID=126333 RepID=A0A8G2F8R3_9BACT|nr:GGDEF domain-containing protein [Halodesulfovibrio aestuarii]SHI99990.1 PAS domain S-box-containing protein/diguanylate cyclase (GGDEF) domain-containing protein [Halodesulfovibrio aestuarii]
MDHAFYVDVLHALADGVYVVDKEQKIIFWNKAAERLTGYGSAEVLGKKCADNMLCHVNAEGQELCMRGCPLELTIQEGKLAEAAVFMRHKNGHRVPVTVKTSPLRDDIGNVIGAVEFFSLSLSRENFFSEFEKLRKEALLDRLTGVGNRRFAEITLENVCSQSKNMNASYGVLFVDIDYFKHINDTWGHFVGDEVLRMVSKSLDSGLRIFDIISRWGGEEFLLILPNITAQDLLIVGERLRMLVETSWYEYEDTIIKVTASFGGVIAKNGEELQSVLQRADNQLYISKDNGRNLVSIEN